jgi:hypothetical protein
MMCPQPQIHMLKLQPLMLLYLEIGPLWISLKLNEFIRMDLICQDCGFIRRGRDISFSLCQVRTQQEGNWLWNMKQDITRNKAR